VHNMNVVNGNNGLIVCMPSRKIKDGSYKDIAHPISNEFRHKLEEAILKVYNVELAKGGVPAAAGSTDPDGD
jgi:stage V sporulation protein G